MNKVLFACVHNAGRSQMARAFFERAADPAKAMAISAGTQPAERVHPEVVAAMAEVGIDVSGQQPRRLTAELARDASLLVTMGCGDECPFVPGARVEDWPLADPKGQGADAVRAIRDEVARRVEALVRSEGWGRPLSDPPSHAYYRACVGAWRTPIHLEVTDPSALAASGMSWADRVSVRLLAAWPRWLGTFAMETTVAYDPNGVVEHTTVVRWLGLPLMRSLETITLGSDGRAFSMTGTQRVGPGPSQALSGRGSVGDDGRRAFYEMQWMGVTIRQSTALDGDLVTVTQEGPGFVGTQRLVRA